MTRRNGRAGGDPIAEPNRLRNSAQPNSLQGAPAREEPRVGILQRLDGLASGRAMKAGFVIALLGVPCFFLSGPNWALAGGGLICLGLGISASLASLLLAAGVFLTARQSIWKALWMVVSPDLLVRALAGPVLLVVGVYLLGAAVGVIPITGRR